MKIRPLIIGFEQRVDIRRVIDYAHAHPINLRAVARSVGRPALAVGHNPENNLILPVGYRCVYNIEEQPVGKCRHLSVSVLGDGVAPNEMAVQSIAHEFDFNGDIKKDMLKVWTEEIGEGKIAVNVLQKL